MSVPSYQSYLYQNSGGGSDYGQPLSPAHSPTHMMSPSQPIPTVFFFKFLFLLVWYVASRFMFLFKNFCIILESFSSNQHEYSARKNHTIGTHYISPLTFLFVKTFEWFYELAWFYYVILFICPLLWHKMKQQHGGFLTAYRNPQPILRPSPISSPTLVVPVSFIHYVYSPSWVWKVLYCVHVSMGFFFFFFLG